MTDDVCGAPLQVVLRSQAQRRCAETVRDRSAAGDMLYRGLLRRA